jgi:phospholipid-binding lipoprotein MlaA
MNFLQWMSGRCLVAVGFCMQLVIFTHVVSAANVSELEFAPKYLNRDFENKEDQNISSNRGNSTLLAENNNAEGGEPDDPGVSGQDSSEYEMEMVLANEEFEDPFAAEAPELPDPYEKKNRAIFDLNNDIYNHFTKHVANGYRFVFPVELRLVVRNLFSNAAMPVKLVSSLVQGKWEKSGRVVGRFLINTTAGLGGMLDVAEQEYDIQPVDENMSQALGHYGVPTGPYLVLPLLGPASVRNLVGRTTDIFLSPAFFFSAPFMVSSGIATGKKVNETSFLVKTKKELEQNSLDEYESVRDFYNQYHYRLVNE